MESKSLVMIGLFIGSGIGGFIPVFWGSNPFSIASVISTGIGGIVGIIIGFKLAHW